MLRVKTVDALPRPMPVKTYGALLAELRKRRDRAMLELMWEGGLRPGEVLGLQLEDISYGQRRVLRSAGVRITRGRCGRSHAGIASSICWKAVPCPR